MVKGSVIMASFKCPVCNERAEISADYDRDTVFYSCPICGRFQFVNGLGNINLNHLGPYLYYHRYVSSFEKTEYRYNTTLDKETCDKYNKDFDDGKNKHGRPVHMDRSLIDSWFPKTFDERVDKILIHIYDKTEHVGQAIDITAEEGYSLLFVDRTTNSFKPERRDELELNNEATFMLNYLKEEEYLDWGQSCDDTVELLLLPKGYSRVDEIQKYSASGRNVVVAMQFKGDTRKLREAIREGIEIAGYHAIFIDEVQHNDFITPELLKHIKECKFLVVDLTHKNNGAYFEEGYAMGLGKEVIQLCKNRVKLHFDIAQKNTIIWNNESDIPDRLANRIKATID